MILGTFRTLLADGAAAPQSPLGLLIPMLAMFGIFYAVIIRPQSKKQKELVKQMETLKAGDKLITSSGIVGVVVSLKEKSITIRSADTKLEILKTAVSEITERASGTSEA